MWIQHMGSTCIFKYSLFNSTFLSITLNKLIYILIYLFYNLFSFYVGQVGWTAQWIWTLLENSVIILEMSQHL